jgi:hypothetical protein
LIKEQSGVPSSRRDEEVKMKRKSLTKKVWVKGLIVECPMGKPLHDCPLNSLRGLPLAQINTVVNGLSAVALKTLLAEHNTCYNHRIQNKKYPLL